MSSEHDPKEILSRCRILSKSIERARGRLKENPGYNSALRIQLYQRERKQLQGWIKPYLVTGKLNDPTPQAAAPQH